MRIGHARTETGLVSSSRTSTMRASKTICGSLLPLLSVWGALASQEFTQRCHRLSLPLGMVGGAAPYASTHAHVVMQDDAGAGSIPRVGLQVLDSVEGCTIHQPRRRPAFVPVVAVTRIAHGWVDGLYSGAQGAEFGFSVNTHCLTPIIRLVPIGQFYMGEYPPIKLWRPSEC